MTELSPADRDQLDQVVAVVEGALRGSIVGVYPHGSLVAGGLRPTSDLDVLVVARERPDEPRRRALLTGLLRVSGRRAPTPGRPVEVTVVAQADLTPWRYPPVSAFQYGEWLRDEYEGGLLPGPREDADLALLVSVARQGEAPLFGQPVGDVLPVVPEADLRAATVAGVPGLLDDLEDDTRNVLLTLARVLTTLRTGEVVPKDVAADKAAPVVPPEHAPVLCAARDDYVGAGPVDWHDARPAARACAAALANEIDTLASA